MQTTAAAEQEKMGWAGIPGDAGEQKDGDAFKRAGFGAPHILGSLERAAKETGLMLLLRANGSLSVAWKRGGRSLMRDCSVHEMACTIP